MPIYEYRCEPCQASFEAFLASSTDRAACPTCQGTDLQRLMSTFAASVPGGRKAGAAPAASAPAPKAGGCGGGCACH